MSRRTVAALAAIAVAAALVVAVSPASARPGVRVGGTLNIDLSTDLDYTDPALAYLSSSW